jgi:photosystem II stability/assembly factor-like uncharacterized protein
MLRYGATGDENAVQKSFGKIYSITFSLKFYLPVKFRSMKFFYSLVCLCLCFSCHCLLAQKYDPKLYNSLKWRMIGPFRGGRTIGASGSARQPNVFYIGVNNGGVWKTTDYGRTWRPVFDDQPTGSIGDVAVAPSNPNTIYVASGEGVQRPDLSEGDGMYKSADGGKTWVHQGIAEALQIGGLAVDPKNEDRVFAAVLGHPYGPNKERGVYRTTNGGKSWEKALYIDENTGAIQVAIDPVNPKVVYADLFASRLAPWENGEWAGPGSGLYKSTDGGNTWKQLKNGLPSVADGLARIGFCIAPSAHNRLYAVVSSGDKTGGLYRSDNGGDTWRKMSGDKRLWDRGSDFAEVKADPKNADIVYDANVMVWKSDDGGKTWNGFKGAPGGDDYHRLWINPANPDVILLASDQGAGITVNGGATWSSWYNQPTAQLYHVSADNAFPYNVYSGQQESGSVGISSRGNDGAITFRDWHPVGAQEYGYVVADPLDPDIIYGGKLSRYDKRTGQTQEISPEASPSGKYRFVRTAPLVFSPVDNRTLYYAGNVMFKTRNGGKSWQTISPDLTRTSYDVPECIGIYRNNDMAHMPQRGVIYTIALSPIDSNTIWAGTDDGLVWVTHNGGGNWDNVTPPGVSSWSKISLMDASHTDVNTAYAAVNCIRLDDQRPHIYRTNDGGKTWTEIVNGLPAGPINVVKEDPQRKGLLFAGSETAVYVSFDDGANWQSLRSNMPATSIRDLIIKDNDLVVATHGRSFWIMDDITPLRQLTDETKAAKANLYKPQTAIRVRWNMNTDTPLPQDEPAGENPPDGAIVDYYLAEKTNGAIALDISDSTGRIIRHYSSEDTLYKIPDVNIPLYWIRPQQVLSKEAGCHRFLWDMHYQPLNVPPGYPIAAIYGNTSPAATSPWVMPGNYTVALTVNGKTLSQPLHVAMDPRVTTSTRSLQLQHDLSLQCYEDQKKCLSAINDISLSIAQLEVRKAKNTTDIGTDTLQQQVNSLLKGPGSFAATCSLLAGLSGIMQDADVKPTEQCMSAVADAHLKSLAVWKKWKVLTEQFSQ